MNSPIIPLTSQEFLCIGAYGLQKKSPPEGQNIITTTRSHSDPKVTGAITACEPTEVIRVGGAGHKVGISFERLYI